MLAEGAKSCTLYYIIDYYRNTAPYVQRKADFIISFLVFILYLTSPDILYVIHNILYHNMTHVGSRFLFHWSFIYVKLNPLFFNGSLFYRIILNRLPECPNSNENQRNKQCKHWYLNMLLPCPWSNWKISEHNHIWT